MTIKLSIAGAEERTSGVWHARVKPTELAHLKGRPGQSGQRSVVLVTDADYRQDTLDIGLTTAVVANLGTTDEVVFVDVYAAEPSTGLEPETARWTRPDRTGVTRASDVSDVPRYYWVTIAKNLRENYELALSHGVWGVESKYGDRLRPVRDGDFLVFYNKDLGFSLCRISGSWFEDRSRIWPDAVYPYRVRIGPAIQRNHDLSLGDVYEFLVDPNGNPYGSVNAAGRAIGGAAGVLRPLLPTERQRLFGLLGWPLDSEGDE